MNRRLPDNVKKMRGTYRKDRAIKSKPATEYPDMPSYLKDHSGAIKIWDEIKAVMDDKAAYAESDGATLAKYCLLESLFREDPREFYKTAASLGHLRLLANDLYLSPESRAKLPAKQELEEPNPFAKYL